MRTLTVAAFALATLLASSQALPGALGQGAPRVRFAQAQDTLSFAPAYLARARFFKDVGIDAQFEILSGGGAVFAALAEGSVDVGLASTADLLAQPSQDEYLAIQAMTYQTIEVVVSAQWASLRGTSKFHGLRQRIGSLKGAVIASASPGTLSDTLAQYLLRFVGLDPAKDAQIVPLGAIGARLAALQANHAQVVLSQPPAGQQAEAEGWGIVLIPSKDLPGFNRQIHHVLVARKSWLARNKDAARRVATSLALGNNYLLDHPGEAAALHQPFYPRLARNVLQQGVRAVRGQTVRNGVIKESEWTRTVELLLSIKAVDRPAPAKEAQHWTNDYIDLARLR